MKEAGNKMNNICIENLNQVLAKYDTNLKQIAVKAGIKYTSLFSRVKKRRVTERDLEKISDALEINLADLKKQLKSARPVPFIKWVGGKTQLLPEIEKHMPKNYGTYFEPFLGGGAVLFNLMPNRAVVNDLNSELINAYQMVMQKPDELIKQLTDLFNRDSKENYLAVRAVDRTGEILNYSAVQRAARFIYLNKAGYNGLWRVNQKGQNNVPYGQHKKLTVPINQIKADSNFLANSDIVFKTGDYQNCTAQIVPGDFVYFDPPYVPVTPTASFTSYTKKGFGLVQQKQLVELARNLASQGVYVMLSNSDTKLTRQLYKNKCFHIHKVKARRSINRNGAKRGKVGEVIITTY